MSMITNNYAVATRTQILYKIKFPNTLFESIVMGGTDDYNMYYNFKSGDIFTEVGVYYYKHGTSTKTRIALSGIVYSQTQDYMSISIRAITNTNGIIYKSRCISTAPIIVLIQGLEQNTVYHIGAYYIKNGTTIDFNEVTVSTRNVAEPAFTLNPATVDTNISSEYVSRAQNYITTLDPILTIVQSMFREAADAVGEHENIVFFSSTGGWGAYVEGALRITYNCATNTPAEILRSIIIHELEHLHFHGWSQSGTFATHDTVIKFMELVTDGEGASWGRISSHYYPNISSAKFDLLDDWIIVMATDVDNLNFNS